MITETNFHMLRDFQNFTPDTFGILTEDEVNTIDKHFHLKERSDIDLQNLRDFVVLFYSNKKDGSLQSLDIMSGICGVIDREKFFRGMEV